MKVIVLVPSDAYRLSAGARIRYGGLREGLSSSGITLELVSIADFDPAAADCDVLIISKCHDARSIIAAATMSGRGKCVGVDLFDDYFSQSLDSRLVPYRRWLADLLQDCDFSLCSTDTMAEVVRSYAPQLPIHVVNDPARAHDPDEAFGLASSKAAQARRDQVIEVCWFGVGDNPFFQVGLIDLFAHSSTLSDLTLAGMTVQLTVLTNRRAMRADGLELLSKLPVPCQLLEWSEEAEAKTLARSLVAFLPVAAQSFSSAKSLNRAFTAMSYGCQVLSVGHPLYAALGPLIYRETAPFLSDLAEDTLRLSSANAAIYSEQLHALGSSTTETIRLKRFLEQLTPRQTPDLARLCVVHGLSTRVEVHELAKSVGGLSVASPYCTANLDFDVSFGGLPPEMEMRFSSDLKAGLSEHSQVKHATKPVARTYRDKGTWRSEIARDRLIAGQNSSVSYQLATYASSMKEIGRRLRELFGPVRLVISETSALPVSGAGET